MRPTRLPADVVRDWASELAQKLGRDVEQIISNGLSARDFSPSNAVEIRHPWGTTVRLELAFALVRPSEKLACIFSEHGGYVEVDLEPGSVVAEVVETQYVQE